MLFKSALVLILLVLEAYGEFLIRDGSYKTKRKGQKKRLSKVESLSPRIIADTSYLKISATIPNLFEASVRDFKLLEELVLSSCGIVEIQPGAFQNLPSLSSLNLKENGIEHLREGVFNGLNISVLLLNKNEIKTIAAKTFDNMPKLTKIKLNSNKISTWNGEWFKGTPLLNHISFRRNEFAEIPNYAFKNIAGYHTVDGKEVLDTKIFLSKNGIIFITPKAFSGLEKLGEIWLDRNELTSLDASLFSGIEKIDFINLSDNNISSLPSSMFANTKVKNFHIRHNRGLKCLPLEVVNAAEVTDARSINKLDCDCINKLTTESASTIVTDCFTESTE